MNINIGCFHFTIFLIAGSYKLWYRYLRLRRLQVRGRCVTDPLHDQVSNCFERALVFMHKMPRIWMDYCSYLGMLYIKLFNIIPFDSTLKSELENKSPRYFIFKINFQWKKISLIIMIFLLLRVLDFNS